jgi:predicted acyl esterase
VTTATSSQPAPGYADVTIERNAECRLSDGVVLRADVYLPAV